MSPRLEWDEPKRLRTLEDRGLDFAEMGAVFEDPNALEIEDKRHDYGERRIIRFGQVKGRLFVVVYTMRRDAAHIISARKANAREQRRYHEQP